MPINVNRRQVIAGGAAASLAALLAPGRFGPALAAVRQETALSLADFGLPELSITATDDGYELSATEIEAGRYLVRYENQAGSEIYASFIQLNDEVTIDTVNEALTSDEEDGPPPAWLFSLPAPGGSTAFPGATTLFALDFHPGAFALHPNAPGSVPAVELTVTGEFPADPPAIESSVHVDMVDMAFNFTGEFTTGAQIAEFSNSGAAHHFAVLIGVPDGTTIDDFFALGAAMATGEFPEDLALTFDNIELAFETATQSPGATVWAELDLWPGTYIISCFVFDPEQGAPHSMLGMTELFTIE